MKKLLLCLGLALPLFLRAQAVPGGETSVAVKPDLVTNDFLHLDSNGYLEVNVETGGGGGGGGTSSNFGAAFPSAGTAFGVSNGTNMVAITLGQAAAASSMPTALANEDVQDQYLTGAASQSATVNNIIPSTSGSAATDTLAGTSGVSYRSFSVAVIGSSGISAGAFTIEGSMDNVNFVTMNVVNAVTASPSFASLPQTVAASTNYYFTGSTIFFRYIRVRISTAISGGTIQCFTRLSTAPWTNNYVAVPAPVGGRAFVTLPSSSPNANNATVYVPMSSTNQMIAHLNGDPTNEEQVTSGTTALASTASTQLFASAGTGIRNYATDITLTNNSTTGGTVSILDGSTVIWTIYLPATGTSLQEVPFTQHWTTPLKGTAATAMNIQLSSASMAVYYNVSGYKNN